MLNRYTAVRFVKINESRFDLRTEIRLAFVCSYKTGVFRFRVVFLPHTKLFAHKKMLKGLFEG